MGKVEVTEEQKEQAQKFKNEGNALVKEQKYKEAIEKYTEAIKCQESAIFYCNRAAAYVSSPPAYVWLWCSWFYSRLPSQTMKKPSKIVKKQSVSIQIIPKLIPEWVSFTQKSIFITNPKTVTKKHLVWNQITNHTRRTSR